MKGLMKRKEYAEVAIYVVKEAIYTVREAICTVREAI